MYKICLPLLSLIIACFFITGCSTYTTQQTTDAKVNCSNGRVLLTNLTQPVQQRHYLLPDTTPCPNPVFY